MTLQQRLLSASALPVLLALVVLCTYSTAAQNKVSFSLQNRQTAAGVYSAELWASVASGSTWQPGNSIITIGYNPAALSIGAFNNAALLTPDAALNSGGYMPMYQSSYGNALSVNIINLSGNFTNKTGSFRIGTVRWTVLNGFQQDSLSFVVTGNDSCIVSDGWNMMWYNGGSADGYDGSTPTPAQAGNPPVITQQPQSQTPCTGAPASFVVQATGALGYQWQRLNGQVWESIAGATSATLPFAAAEPGNTGSYRVLITGNAPPVATSNTVALSLLTGPVVTTNPQPVTVCEGEGATFQVEIGGTPSPLLFWEQSTDDGSTWSSILDATTATLTLPQVTASMHGSRYRVRAMNTCGSSTSAPALLSVHTAPVITVQPLSVVATVGNSVAFSVTATGTTPTYRWQKNGSDIAGATTPTLTLANVQLADIGLYRSIVQGVCGTADTSEMAPLVVYAADTTRTTLVVKALMQGYWNGSTHARTPVSVELRTGSVLLSSTLATIATGILNENGVISLSFDDVQSGDYWIVVRHGGYLPVASNGPVQITRGGTLNYDFSDSATKAYLGGTIATLINGQTYYVLKGGDLNGNRAVNPQDLPFMLIGYPKTNSSVPGL